MIDAVRCVLMHYFDQIKSYKSSIVYYKSNYYSYTPGYILLLSVTLPEKLKKHALVDAFYIGHKT